MYQVICQPLKFINKPTTTTTLLSIRGFSFFPIDDAPDERKSPFLLRQRSFFFSEISCVPTPGRTLELHQHLLAPLRRMDLRPRDMREIIHRPTWPGSTRLFIPFLLLLLLLTTPPQRLRHPFLPRGPPPPPTTTPFPSFLHRLRLRLRLRLRQLDFPPPLHLIKHEPGRRESEDADGDAHANGRHGARARVVFIPASSSVVGARFLVQEGLGGGGEGGWVQGPEGGWLVGEGGEVEGDALGDVGYVCGGGELEGAGLVGGW